MEAFQGLRFLLIFSLFVSFAPQWSEGKSPGVVDLDEKNWTRMLEGEWMVEFMAPWCPACSSLKGTWSTLGTKSSDLGIKVATVDVTTSPGLSGRFLVTALPTIYHVINGELRQFSGPRDLESLVSFVSQSKWRALTPAPWYRDPSKPHMALLSHFFKLSQMLRSIHNTLLEEYGVPTYGSYLIFAIATIFLGAILGLIVVCTIDFLFPPKIRSERRPPPSGTQKEEELLNDDLVDEEEEGEEEEEDDSDLERNSQSDTPEESDTENAPERQEAGGDTKDEKSASPEASPSVRKRKPRKAD